MTTRAVERLILLVAHHQYQSAFVKRRRGLIAFALIAATFSSSTTAAANFAASKESRRSVLRVVRAPARIGLDVWRNLRARGHSCHASSQHKRRRRALCIAGVIWARTGCFGRSSIRFLSCANCSDRRSSVDGCPEALAHAEAAWWIRSYGRHRRFARRIAEMLSLI